MEKKLGFKTHIKEKMMAYFNLASTSEEANIFLIGFF